jgi:pseudouridine-5'-phosphate glycosidase
MIIANPIPALSEIPKHKMDKFINEAIQLAEANGITGKDNTPYILEKIKELSAGQSVIANRELVISNARCAAAIARILCTGYMPPGSSSLELGVRPSQEVESTIPMQWELTEG